MAKLKDEAMAYEPMKTKNIADLEVVSVDVEITDETYTDSEGKEFTMKTIEIDGEKYRVPVSVIKALKTLLEDNPNLKSFKVKKIGSGMNTEYVVIPISKI